MRSVFFNIIFCSAVSASGLALAEAYFITIFSFQDKNNSADLSHTFAHFIGLTESGKANDSFTISWMPKREIVCLPCLPEIGANWSLFYTLDFAISHNYQIAKWGPYEIYEELFEMAEDQYDFLNSGRIKYKAVDQGYREVGFATNCMHAVSDIDIRNRRLQSGTNWGRPGSAQVARFLKPWMVDPSVVHQEVSRLIGLDQYPIETVPVKAAF